MKFIGYADSRLRDWVESHETRISDEEIARIALGTHGNFGGYRHESNQEITILTDHSGSVPIYYGRTASGVAVSEDPRKVARELNLKTLDPVSAVDFILNGTVCFPYTVTEGIRVAPPGSITRVKVENITSKRYFEPFEEEAYGSAADFGDELGCLLREACQFGLDGCETIKVLFSGGEDARAVVGLLPKGRDITLYTVADGENRELRLARSAARKLGYPFVAGLRPDQFYRKDLVERIDATSGQFDVSHTHIWGKLAEPLAQADAIVGGFTSDTLFKSLWMGNVDRPRISNFWVERLSDNSPKEPRGVRWDDPSGRLDESLVQAVRERRLAHQRRIKRIRAHSAANWHNKWPLGTQQNQFAHLLATRQIGPRVVEPFMDGQVYRLASRMPDSYRVDRKAFRYLFNNPFQGASLSLSSSGRVPYFNGFVGAVTSQLVLKYWGGKDRLSRGWARFQGKPWVSQGAWTPDHIGFDFQVDDYLSDDDFDSIMASIGWKNFSNADELNQTHAGAVRFRRRARFRGFQLAIFQRSLSKA